MISAMQPRAGFTVPPAIARKIAARWTELEPFFRILVQSHPERLAYWREQHSAFVIRCLALGIEMRTIRRLRLDDLRQGITACVQERAEYIEKRKRRKHNAHEV